MSNMHGFVAIRCAYNAHFGWDMKYFNDGVLYK